MVIDGWGWTWRHRIAAGFVILLFAIGDYGKTTSVPIVVSLSLGKKFKLGIKLRSRSGRQYIETFRILIACILYSIHHQLLVDILNISRCSIHTHIYTHTQTHTYIHTHTHTCLRTYTHTRTHTYIRTYILFLYDCKLLEQERQSNSCSITHKNWPMSKIKLINKFNKNFKKLRTIYRLTNYRQL